MINSPPHSTLRQSLLDWFSCEDVFLLSKGRIALYAALKALGIGPGDEVLLPGYTCVVVPGVIKRLGAVPVYVDVEEQTYNLSVDALASRITSKSKALLVQHTYGIPCDMPPLLDLAAKHNLHCIEDCCHAFGSTDSGSACGTFGEASFFSGQWNKPFSTGLGGMLIVNKPGFSQSIQEVLDDEFHTPSSMEEARLSLQQFLHTRLVNPRTVMLITRLYRFASRTGMMIGSSSNQELEGVYDPRDLKVMARCQAAMGAEAMQSINENLKHRKMISGLYREALSSFDRHPVEESKAEQAVMVRYPLRVKNKSKVLSAAERHGREIGTWFESPVHPLHDSWRVFDYRAGECPVGERLSDETINLPTHSKVSPEEANAIVQFIHDHAQAAG